MEKINDLQIGKAGEYLVCADLIINGHIAFPSEQGLPFDVVLEYKGRLLKVQVKTTRAPKNIPQRKTSVPAFIFHIGTNGKENRRKKYCSSQVDIFALVDLESKQIAYLPFFDTKTTMNFRVPKFKGSYHDEQGKIKKEQVLKLKKDGLSAKEISLKTGLNLPSVERYSSNISITQKGTNSGVYFDTFDFNRCIDLITSKRE